MSNPAEAIMSENSVVETLEIDPAEQDGTPPRRAISRRELIVGAGGLFAAAATGSWLWNAMEHFQRAQVFIAAADSYDADLVGILRGGLAELGLGRETIRGKSILLKPNLVEPS